MRAGVMTTAGGGRWWCGSFLGDPPDPTRSRRVPARTHHRCRVSWQVSQLGSSQPASLPSSELVPPPASAPPTWPRDRTSTSPGRSAGFTSQSEPAEQLRSSASPNQRLLGSLAPPTPRPGAGSFLSLLPREAILTCRAQGFATRLVLPSPTPGPSSAQLLHDHAVPHLHTQMAEDLVTRITFPWRDSLGGSAGVQHRALTLVLRAAWKST